jgi:hypothetical protein
MRNHSRKTPVVQGCGTRFWWSRLLGAPCARSHAVLLRKYNTLHLGFVLLHHLYHGGSSGVHIRWYWAWSVSALWMGSAQRFAGKSRPLIPHGPLNISDELAALAHVTLHDRHPVSGGGHTLNGFSLRPRELH